MCWSLARHSEIAHKIPLDFEKERLVLTSILLTVTGAKAWATVTGPLTSGMVGIPVTIEYDDSWNGLTKNLVCRCGEWGPDSGETRTVLNIEETATVAHEVMKADMHLYLAIQGSTADGKLVIPTTWADCGRIEYGANVDADPSALPRLSIWSQLQTDIRKLKQSCVSEEQIADAVEKYLEKTPIEVPDDSRNVKLPLNEDGTSNHGTTGWYAVSDGNGGIRWIETEPDTDGDDSGGETTEPLETSLEVTWSNGSLTNGIFTPDSNTPAYVATEPVIDGTKTDTKVVFRASDDYLTETPINQVRFLLYSDAEAQTFVGEWNLTSGSVVAGAYSYQSVDLDTAYFIPAGYYMRIFMSKGYNPANFSSNATLKSYVTGSFVEFYSVSAGAVVATSELSVNDDYAMDYGVSTLSLVADDMTSAEASNAGINQTFANTVISAMNAWMKEYRGNVNKIPLIIHTDQHGRMNRNIKPLFDLLNSKTNWYEVSKVMNLGDTVSDRWIDADTTESLLVCTDLENMLECVASIPFSKRLDVFGNHDTWYTNADGEDTVLTDFSHLSQYFKNIYARRTNNQGWFVVKDDYFNVKYVVISGFEYTTSRSTRRIGTAQMKWIIDEFGKDDGYDIVVVSHVPLHYVTDGMTFPTGHEATATEDYRVSKIDTDEFFAARKNKTSGTVTDSDGVEHSYDFSGCTTNVLCALHGHAHHDAYNYVGTDGLLSVAFDWFDENTIHFALVDRENRQLRVWKVDNSNTVLEYQIPMDILGA